MVLTMVTTVAQQPRSRRGLTTPIETPRPGAGSLDPLDLRASDGDRERVVERLRAHAAEGRLTVAELEDRTERGLAARTLGELAALTGDLPERRPSPPPARRRSVPRRDLATFVVVMALLVGIWAVSGAGYFWPIWPLVGWGAFVLGPTRPFAACGRHRRAARGTA